MSFMARLQSAEEPSQAVLELLSCGLWDGSICSASVIPRNEVVLACVPWKHLTKWCDAYGNPVDYVC